MATKPMGFYTLEQQSAIRDTLLIVAHDEEEVRRIGNATLPGPYLNKLDKLDVGEPVSLQFSDLVTIDMPAGVWAKGFSTTMLVARWDIYHGWVAQDNILCTIKLLVLPLAAEKKLPDSWGG